jgi:hypothetical protein
MNIKKEPSFAGAELKTSSQVVEEKTRPGPQFQTQGPGKGLPVPAIPVPPKETPPPVRPGLLSPPRAKGKNQFNLPPVAKHNQMLALVAKAPTVAKALIAARKAHAEYRLRYEKLLPFLNRDSEAKNLLIQIQSEDDVARVAELQTEYAKITGPAGDAAKQNAQRLARRAFADLKLPLLELIEAMEAEIARLEQEWVQAEGEFFKRFDLPRQETAVTARLAGVQTNLIDHARKQLHREGVLATLVPNPREGEFLIHQFAGLGDE